MRKVLDAALFFYRSVFPLVRKSVPDAKFIIAGYGTPEELTSLQEKANKVYFKFACHDTINRNVPTGNPVGPKIRKEKRKIVSREASMLNYRPPAQRLSDPGRDGIVKTYECYVKIKRQDQCR